MKAPVKVYHISVFFLKYHVLCIYYSYWESIVTIHKRDVVVLMSLSADDHLLLQKVEILCREPESGAT